MSSQRAFSDTDGAEQDPTGALARMLIETPFSALPASVVELSKKAILDTVAVSLAGSSWEVSPAIAELVREWGGAPQSRVLVYGYRVAGPLAAFANGVMARAIDMGDTHERAGHISEWNVPTLLSALDIAAGPVSGADFITAYATSAELGARVGCAVHGMGHTTEGLTGELWGPLCATAAAARLMGATHEEAWNALGICHTVHTLGEMSKYSEGTQMPRVQHGFAGDTAIKAVTLAQRGVTGPKNLFLGVPSGILRVIPWDDINSDYLSDGLGSRWVFAEGLSMKPYPSCKFTHSLIASTAELVTSNGLDPSEIELINGVGSSGARMTFEPTEAKWNPRTAAEAMYSAPYTMATAALTGGFFLEDLSPAELVRADKRALMAKVRMSWDDTLDQSEGFPVTIIMRGGRRFAHVTPFTKGHMKNPMDWDDLADKLRRCAAHAARPFGEAQIEQIVDLCRSLDSAPDAKALLELLAPGPD